MTRIAAVLTLVLTLPTSARSANRQDPSTIVITDTACATCEVELEFLATLGDVEGDGMLLDDDSLLSRDSRGHFYLCSPGRPYVWIFDSTGRFLHRLGGVGQGPGELFSVSALVVGEDDSLYVFDPRQRRMLVFSPEHEHIQTVPLGFGATPYAALTKPGIVLNAGIHSESRIGYPLHLLDLTEHRIVRSFGSVDGVYRPDMRDIIDGRVVTPANDTAVWSAWWNQYVIERWGTDGSLEQTIRREVEWFEPWWIPRSGPEVEPQTLIKAIMQEGDVIWTSVQVADPEWRTTVRRLPEGNRYTVDDYNRYKDTYVEALDVARGIVLATTKFPDALQGFVSPSLVYGQSTDETGHIMMSVWHMGISNSGQ